MSATTRYTAVRALIGTRLRIPVAAVLAATALAVGASPAGAVTPPLGSTKGSVVAPGGPTSTVAGLVSQEDTEQI